MVRKKAKDSKVDTELVYAYAKTKQLGPLEEFISSPNQANLQVSTTPNAAAGASGAFAGTKPPPHASAPFLPTIASNSGFKRQYTNRLT